MLSHRTHGESWRNLSRLRDSEHPSRVIQQLHPVPTVLHNVLNCSRGYFQLSSLDICYSTKVQPDTWRAVFELQDAWRSNAVQRLSSLAQVSSIGKAICTFLNSKHSVLYQTLCISSPTSFTCLAPVIWRPVAFDFVCSSQPGSHGTEWFLNVNTKTRTPANSSFKSWWVKATRSISWHEHVAKLQKCSAKTRSCDGLSNNHAYIIDPYHSCWFPSRETGMLHRLLAESWSVKERMKKVTCRAGCLPRWWYEILCVCVWHGVAGRNRTVQHVLVSLTSKQRC